MSSNLRKNLLVWHDFSVDVVVICMLFKNFLKFIQCCYLHVLISYSSVYQASQEWCLGIAVLRFFSKLICHIHFVSFLQYLQMKWPLLDVQAGTLQSRQALKDARSPSPAHIVVSDLIKAFASFTGGRWRKYSFVDNSRCLSIFLSLKKYIFGIVLDMAYI